jgi:hypothetical protein
LVGGGAADQAEVSLETATKDGTNRLAVGLAFSLEFCETRVGRIAVDFRQRGMLEVALTVVYVGDRDCLCRGPVVVGADNSVSSRQPHRQDFAPRGSGKGSRGTTRGANASLCLQINKLSLLIFC